MLAVQVWVAIVGHLRILEPVQSAWSAEDWYSLYVLRTCNTYL